MAMCPYCGKALELVGRDMTPTAPWENVRIYESSASFPWPGAGDAPAEMWQEWERREPVRSPTFDGDVRVPLAQSVICGVFVTLLSVPLAVIVEWPLYLAPVAGLVVASAVWAAFLGQHRAMMWRVETILNRDIDGDGAAGRPVEHRTVIEGRIDDGRNIRDLILYFDDVPPEKIDLLFQAALGGQSLSEPAWCGKGKPFSKPQFVGVRDRMIETGLWAWVNPEAHAQGVQVLANGRVLMSRWRAQFARTHAHALDVV